MPSTTARLKTLAEQVTITSEYGRTRKPWDQYDEWQKEAHPYRVRMRYKGRSLTVDFWMGQAHTAEPDAEGVLDCLLSDASAGEQDFHEFCSEFGYDEDSRKAEKVWKACKQTAPKLRRFLGDDYETFLYADRN